MKKSNIPKDLDLQKRYFPKPSEKLRAKYSEIQQKLAKDPKILKKRRESAKRVANTPEFKEKLKLARLNADTDLWYKNIRKGQQQSSGIKVEIMFPNNTFKKFPSTGDLNRFLQDKFKNNVVDISSNPSKCFPKDGSWKQWFRGPLSGYKTRRIIAGKERPMVPKYVPHGNLVEVENPNGVKKLFESAQAASKFYDISYFGNASHICFPKDGKVYVHTKKKLTGWKTRRIIGQ